MLFAIPRQKLCFLNSHAIEVNGALPLFIRIALVLIAISVFASIVVYLVIFFSRVLAAYLGHKRKQAQNLISNKLTDYLFFMENLGPVSRSQFKEVTAEFQKIKEVPLKRELVRQVFIDELIYLKRHFTDQTSRVLGRLYQNLGLIKTSVSKLKNPLWEVKARGIIELREMAPFLSSGDIIPYLSSKNDDLRVEAQAAYIRLNTENAFGFLTYAPEHLSEWHQIILFDIITKNNEIVIPSFDTWLISYNPTVVIFCLKLIVHFMQFNAIPNIVKLLDHPNKRIVDRAINALGKLEADKTIDLLIGLYPKLNQHCKIETLVVLGRMGTVNHLYFLDEAFLQSKDYFVQMNAMRSRLAITNENYGDILAAFPDVSFQQKAVINHCMDKLI